jgi:transcriptional regulator of acetoin/glycerol metabolism
LENVIVSAVVKAKNGTIRLEYLKEKLREREPAAPRGGNRKKENKVAARQALRAALMKRLQENGRDMDEAAGHFGKKKSWAYELLKEAC